MSEPLDLRAILPWLGGREVHLAHQRAAPAVLGALRSAGFVLYELDGSRIVDEASFFTEVKEVLRFPDWFGRNWDAFNDCFGDFPANEGLEGRRFAIVWHHAERAFSTDLQLAVFASIVLGRNVRGFRAEWEEDPTQFEVVVLGEGPGFPDLREMP